MGPTIRRALCLVAPLVLVLSGCRVQLDTSIDIGLDGKGTITQSIGFDAAALRRVGDPARALRADDLVAAGWVVEPAVTEGDLTWVRIRHDFSTPEQANDLFAQLSSPEGPYRDFEVIRTTGPLSDSVRFTGLLDTSAGLSVFGDKALADAFGGDASGGLVARVEREEGRPAAEMVDLDLTVVTGGTSRTWTASFAEPSVQNLRVADSRSKVFDLLGRIVLTLLALLTVTVIALRIRVRRRRSRRLMRRTTRRW